MITILAVDDEPGLAEFYGLLLVDELGGPENCTVVTGENVGDAGKALAGTVPDLVICDMRMPDGTGLDVLAAIKQSPKHAKTKFILISGTLGDVAESDPARGQIQAMLAKPVNFQELKATVLAVLANPQ